MSKPDDFEGRLRAYLARGARTEPAPGLNDRLRTPGHRPPTLALQLVAAGAVVLLAIAIFAVLRAARPSGLIQPAGTPSATVTASATATPSVSASPAPSITTGGPTAYPLTVPVNLHMASTSTGWASSGGADRVLRTHDGGASWQDVTPHAARPGTWVTFFLDADHAWVASSVQPGSGSSDFTVKTYRTSDGGRSWQTGGDVAADQGWPGTLDFVDSRHGWLIQRLGVAAGSEGEAFYGTVDGGMTWSRLSETDASGAPGHLPLSCDKTSPYFVDASTGWAPGSCGAGGGPYFFVTRDGGSTWNDTRLAMPTGQSAPCMCEISDLRFSDSRNGSFALSIFTTDPYPSVYLYSTRDGGATWRPGPLLPRNATNTFFVDAQHGFTLDAKANVILYTSDAGQHWSNRGTVPSTQVPQAVEFVDLQTGWVLGSEPGGQTILKTADGGQTWSRQFGP